MLAGRLAAQCRSMQQYTARRSQWPCSAAVAQLLLSDKLLALLRQALGPDVHLFNEQVRRSSAAARLQLGCSSGLLWAALGCSVPRNPVLLTIPGCRCSVTYLALCAAATHANASIAATCALSMARYVATAASCPYGPVK